MTTETKITPMAKFTDTPILTDRFSQALVFASQAHSHQVRKGNREVPYVSHLLAVASLVLESGGDEDEAIAALLHDAIEDIQIHPALIDQKFGCFVLGFVQELTEDKSLPKPERKAAYVKSILSMSESALRISIADKLHNIRCYSINPQLWGQEQHEFYGALLDNYEQRELEGVEEQLVEMNLLFEQLS
jgi:(p)ppGpp synthase/HD superfamily hydrolase